MLNQELELSLNMAFARAREHRHEFMTVEHLLLALLSNPSAREALEACSVDLVALRQELEAFIEQTTPVLPASEEERDTQPTLSFQRVLQRAVFHVTCIRFAKDVEAWKRVLLSGSTMPKGLVSSALKAAAKIFSLIIPPFRWMVTER